MDHLPCLCETISSIPGTQNKEQTQKLFHFSPSHLTFCLLLCSLSSLSMTTTLSTFILHGITTLNKVKFGLQNKVQFITIWSIYLKYMAMKGQSNSDVRRVFAFYMAEWVKCLAQLATSSDLCLHSLEHYRGWHLSDGPCCPDCCWFGYL